MQSAPFSVDFWKDSAMDVSIAHVSVLNWCNLLILSFIFSLQNTDACVPRAETGQDERHLADIHRTGNAGRSHTWVCALQTWRILIAFLCGWHSSPGAGSDESIYSPFKHRCKLLK